MVERFYTEEITIGNMIQVIQITETTPKSQIVLRLRCLECGYCYKRALYQGRFSCPKCCSNDIDFISQTRNP